jgi:hypothetical protein
MFLLTVPAVIILIIIHLFSKFVPLDRAYCKPWLSLGGGISLAYVFVVLLPEITRSQAIFQRASTQQELFFLENIMFIVALLGLLVFYSLEQLALYSRENNDKDDITTSDIFSIHIVSFAFHNFLIAYLLNTQEEQSALGLLFYTIAITLHILANDFTMREHHQHQYDMYGRWIIVAATLIGWLTGALLSVPPLFIATHDGLSRG